MADKQSIRAAGYIRVNSKEQTEGESLTTQRYADVLAEDIQDAGRGHELASPERNGDWRRNGCCR